MSNRKQGVVDAVVKSQQPANSRLSALRDRYGRSRAERAATAFMFDPDNPQLLAAALRADPLHPDVLALADILDGCTKGNRCRLTICPACGDTKKRGAAIRMIRDLIEHGVDLGNMEHISFVTVNGAAVHSIDQNLIEERKKSFAKKVRNTRARKAKVAAWTGHFEFGITANSRMHLHAIVYHPKHSKSELTRILRKSFHDPRAVNIAVWKTKDKIYGRPLGLIQRGKLTVNDFNLANVARYVCKHIPDVPSCYEWIEDDYPKLVKRALPNASRLLGEWLLKTQRLRKKEYQGSRFRTGIHKRAGWGWRWNRSRLRYINAEGQIEKVFHFACIDAVIDSKSKLKKVPDLSVVEDGASDYLAFVTADQNLLNWFFDEEVADDSAQSEAASEQKYS